MASSHVTKHLGAILAFATAAMSQNNYSSLCNSSISNANASGIFTLPESFAPGARLKQIHPSWAVTVSGGNGNQINKNLWYDTAGENYGDDLAINYDVCAFIMYHLPENAYRLGQDDPGNCSSVLTDQCINSITHMATVSAAKWTTYSSPPPYENLTAGVLPSICEYILLDLKETLGGNCSKQLSDDIHRPDDVPPTTQVALTGYNESILEYSNCTLSAGDRTFRPLDAMMWGHDDDREVGNDAGYDNATQEINPVLTVFMPVANVARVRNGSEGDRAMSVLQCVRAGNFSEGSRVSPELPEGTPWPSGSGLSAGAKGGIAAGVVVFVLVVGGLLLCLWLVKRKKRARAAAAVAEAQSDGPASDDDKKLPLEADGDGGVHELTPLDRKPEIDGADVSELGGGNGKPSELAGTSAPVELPAENGGR